MSKRAWSRLVRAVLVLLSTGCGAAPAPAPLAEGPAPRPAAPILGPARYLMLDRALVDRGEDGIERAVASGRRLLLRGPEITAAGPAEPAVDGGAALPAWAPGAARYVFWKGTRLWGAETFEGPLRPLGSLPSEPTGAFAWLDGVGVMVAGGVLLVRPSGTAPVPVGVPALARGIAAGARRALAVTALGHAWLTVDGGASYRDVSADLAGARSLEVRGEGIAVELPDGRPRMITASGEIVDGPGGSRREAAAAGGSRGDLTAERDPFFDASQVRSLEAAIRSGLPLADGGVVIAGHGHVGRLDTATLRASSVAPLDPGLRDAACTPVRAGRTVLLACVGAERAAVVDLDGAPRTEKSFDLTGAADLDRFVTGDDALGFLGPCDGTPPRTAETGQPGAAGEPEIPTRQQTPAFCVRAGRGEWVEHRLPPAEARELLAWIPRAGGGAVALLTRAGPFLEERDRVSVRGELRVVRLARGEPPLSPAGSTSQVVDGVDDALRVLADDTITGWLPGTAGGATEMGVVIDAGGRGRLHAAPPHVTTMAHAGPLALAGGDDGRLWETVDGGRRWSEVEAPPAGRDAADPPPIPLRAVTR